MTLSKTDDPLDLSPLAEAIRGSSNWRFAWQFFRLPEEDLSCTGAVASALETITRDSGLHAFLAESMDKVHPRKFKIEPLHVHASIVSDPSHFLDTMARASHDRLGAYSPKLSASTAEERQLVHRLFSPLGPYSAYRIQPGHRPDCPRCQSEDTALFSNWFYGIAWDYTFLVAWPAAHTLWMGCLTDTD